MSESLDRLQCPSCGSKLAPKEALGSGTYGGECAVCHSKIKFRVKEASPCGSKAPKESHGCEGKCASKCKPVSAAKGAGSPDPVTSISFTLNGTPVTVNNPNPLMTLNEYIRTVANLKGTKKSCLEGGCGACVVSLTQFDPVQQKNATFSVNSCLRPLCSVDGSSVTTIEALSTPSTGQYNPISTTLAQYNGSQCGFCSSGFVMNMYSLLQSNPTPSQQQIEDLFDGNICRCTGYRPILDAMRTFAADSPSRGDIEDLAKVASRPCSKLPCARECNAPSARKAHVLFESGPYVWTRPLSLAEVFEDLSTYSGQAIKLVFGNTSIGIFKDDPSTVFIDMSNVPELQVVQATSSSLTVGAGISIANLINILEANGSMSASYGVLVEHLSIVANVAVRNAGCWAGNLMLTHNNADFPSDIFTIMAAANATLTIASAGGSQVYDLFSFLQLDMTGCVIVSITIPVLSAGQKLGTFKIMPRHVNSHAYVNAGFLMTVDANQNVIGTPRFVYGGIGPYAVLAPKTAQAFVGQNLNNMSTLSSAMVALQGELVPDQPPAAASGAYRVSLACSLLYKFYLSFLPNADPRVQSAAVPFVRPISSGTQSFTTDPSEYPVSEPMPKLSALLQTSGQAQYTDDMPITPGTLFAAFAVSTVGPATLAGLDLSAALSAPGVVRILTAADLPGPNNFYGMGVPEPEPIVVALQSQVMYAGQAIAIVLASTQVQADAAALLVTATYTNQLTPILNITEARANPTRGIVQLNVPPLIAGNVEQAFQTAANVVQGRIDVGGQYHFHMETQTSYAVPQEDGGLQLYAATQGPDFVTRCVSTATGLPANKIRVELRRMGGAYGGKITRALHPAVAVSVAAMVTGLPVRTQLNLNTNMEVMGKRNPFEADYTVAFDASGILQGVQIDYYIDCGCYINDSVGTMGAAMDTCDNAYYCPNWLVNANFAITNTPAHTACRGPGCTPAIFIMETIMEHVAKTLQVTPDSVRFANMYQQGQVTPYGQPIQYCSLTDLWNSLYQNSSYAQRLAAVQAFNAANRWRKRGISIAPNKYGLGWSGAFYGVLVSISAADGTIVISMGGCESGQGADTKVAQACAYFLGVPLSLIRLQPTDSFINPNNMCTGGSITSEICVLAVQNACETLNTRLNAVKQTMTNPTWQELVAQCYNVGVDISAKGWAAPLNPGTNTPYAYNSYGVVANEVELDVLTGEIQVLQTDILFDCGQSLNPMIDVGQVEGGFMMGLGYFLTEELIYDPETGALLTNGTWEYKPPSVLDIPIVLNVTLLPNAPNPLGVLRSKASGEPPLAMAANVLFAIKQAVEAALGEIGQDNFYFALNAPATVDSVQTSCLVKPSQFYF